MYFKSFIASLLFAAVAVGAPVELETRQDSGCSSVQLVHASGTTEMGLGVVGAPLARALASAFPGATSYSVPYSTVAEYFATVRAGSAMTVNYLKQQSAKCPDQKFVLSGYSKGAMVMHGATLDESLKSKVMAVIVFGDPLRSSRTATWPINSPSVNMEPRRGGAAAAQNVASFCNARDMFCNPPGTLMPHLAYSRDGSIQAAADFAKANA